MACCGQKRPAPQPTPRPSVQPATLTLNGRTTQYGSRLEAAAANIRAGGSGIVRPVVR